MPYEIVVKNWWKENKAWPDGLEPDGWGEPEIIRRDVQTEDEARQICRDYNATHEPGRLSRKAEYRDDGTQKEYNGYPNWHTWCVQLWIDNDENWYKLMRRILRHYTRMDREIDAGTVIGFTKEYAIRQRITDMEPEDWKYVDWDFLAEHWEEERQEMIEYEND